MKFATSLLAAAAISTAAFADQSIRNDQKGFQLTLPDSWIDTSGTTADVAGQFDGPNIEGTKTNCNVTSDDSTDTVTMTQFQINAEVSAGAISEQSIAEAKSIDPNTQVISQDVVEMNGVAVQRAEFIMNFPNQGGGAAIPVHARKLIVVVPGRYYNVNCMVVQSGYEQVKGDFDKIMSSFAVVKP